MITGFLVPNSIPAEDVDLLRHLIKDPNTPELEFETWIRKYPHVIDSDLNKILPKRKFLLPGEPTTYWEPDVLYQKMGEAALDIVELKRANMKLISGGNKGPMECWKPSSAPRPSSLLSSAISQLSLYINNGTQNSAFLDSEYRLKLCFPQGILIAGQDVDQLVNTVALSNQA